MNRTLLHPRRTNRGRPVGKPAPSVAPIVPWTPCHLSPRQAQIAVLAIQGKPYKVIAKELGISKQTVKNHVSTLLHKLRVATLGEALALMYGCTVANCPQRLQPRVQHVAELPDWEP